MNRRKNEAPRLTVPRATHRSTVKRLYCVECGAMRDAHKAARATEYGLRPCMHVRSLLSSERVALRNEEHNGND
jgi:hypothetical protein